MDTKNFGFLRDTSRERLDNVGLYVRYGLEAERAASAQIIEKLEKKDLSDPRSAKNMTTSNHSLSVANLMYEYAQKVFGFSQEQAMKLYLSGLVHDVGKIHTPPDILNKEGPLNDEEYIEMSKHANAGFSELEKTWKITDHHIIDPVDMHHLKRPKDSLIRPEDRDNGVPYNKDHWYPTGADGYLNLSRGDFATEKVPKVYRLIALCDIYDAMVDGGRPYKNGASLAKTFSIINDGPIEKKYSRAFFQDILSKVREHSITYSFTAHTDQEKKLAREMSGELQEELGKNLDDLFKDGRLTKDTAVIMVTKDIPIEKNGEKSEPGISITIMDKDRHPLVICGQDGDRLTSYDIEKGEDIKRKKPDIRNKDLETPALENQNDKEGPDTDDIDTDDIDIGDD